MPASPAVSKIVLLPSGLALAVEEFGAPDGVPVLFFHGWPSGAAQGALLHTAALNLGIRVISPSRPGVGESSAQADRRLVDWPATVRELIGALGLEKVRVLGVSGGGPYALVSAWALPAQVEAVAVVCGAPPLAETSSTAGFNLAYRTLLAIYRHSRGVVRYLFRLMRPFAQSDPPEWLQGMLRGALVGPDRAALADPEIARLCTAGFRAAWGPHADGVFEDAEIYTQPWGFPIEEIRVPVRVWHGTEDGNFSHALAAYAERIPGVQIRIMENEGHYSLPILRAPEILADLIAAPAKP